MYKLSDTSKKRMEGVDDRLHQIANAALTISKIDFGIPQDGGVRTAERQYALFKRGRSKCDGYENKSPHQSGKALDFYAYVDGKASWDELHLAMVAAAFMQAACALGIKIKWGGLFGKQDGKPGWDMPHIELVD